MATNMVYSWTKTQIVQNAIALGSAGGNAGDPVRIGSLNGVNLWGTSIGRVTTPTLINGYGQGIGIPAGYAMLALDGGFKMPVVVATTAMKEGDPVYITSAQVLTNVSAGNTLYGFADEPAAITTAPGIKIAVSVSNAI